MNISKLFFHGPSPLALAALLPFLLTACPSDDGGDAGDDIGDTTGTGTETGTDTGTETGTAEGTDTTAGTDTMGGDTMGSETSDSDTTDTSETTGEVDPEVMELCVEACAVLDNCDEGYPECVDDCVSYTGGIDDQVCANIEKAFLVCIGGLTCEELQHYFSEDPLPYPCQTEEEALCDEEPCVVGVGMGENPQECNMSIECVDEPVYMVECNADGCTCFEDDVELTTCQLQAEICTELDSDLIYACCFG